MPTDRQVDQEGVVYTHPGIFLSRRKNGTVPFAATWMDLEMIVPSELDRERQILCDIICTRNPKKWHQWVYLEKNDLFKIEKKENWFHSSEPAEAENPLHCSFLPIVSLWAFLSISLTLLIAKGLKPINPNTLSNVHCRFFLADLLGYSLWVIT